MPAFPGLFEFLVQPTDKCLIKGRFRRCEIGRFLVSGQFTPIFTPTGLRGTPPGGRKLLEDANRAIEINEPGKFSDAIDLTTVARQY